MRSAGALGAELWTPNVLSERRALPLRASCSTVLLGVGVFAMNEGVRQITYGLMCAGGMDLPVDSTTG